MKIVTKVNSTQLLVVDQGRAFTIWTGKRRERELAKVGKPTNEVVTVVTPEKKAPATSPQPVVVVEDPEPHEEPTSITEITEVSVPVAEVFEHIEEAPVHQEEIVTEEEAQQFLETIEPPDLNPDESYDLSWFAQGRTKNILWRRCRTFNAFTFAPRRFEHTR
jgi:hypothetical protein